MEDELQGRDVIWGRYTHAEYFSSTRAEDLLFPKITLKHNFGVSVPVIHLSSLPVTGTKWSIIVAVMCHQVILLSCTTKGSCHKCDFGAIDF